MTPPFDAAARAREIVPCVCDHDDPCPCMGAREKVSSALQAAYSQGDAAGYARGIYDAAKLMDDAFAMLIGHANVDPFDMVEDSPRCIRALAAGGGTGGTDAKS